MSLCSVPHTLAIPPGLLSGVFYMYMGQEKQYAGLTWIGLLSMKQNMTHDYHGGRERIMVCTKVKGHTPI